MELRVSAEPAAGYVRLALESGMWASKHTVSDGNGETVQYDILHAVPKDIGYSIKCAYEESAASNAEAAAALANGSMGDRRRAPLLPLL